MSLQALWEKSIRTGVRSTRIGKRSDGFVLRRATPGEFAAAGRRDGRCGTSTGCRGPCARCGGPGRPASETPVRDTPEPARWRSPSLGAAASLLGEKDVDRLSKSPPQQVRETLEGNQAGIAGGENRRQLVTVDRRQKEQRPHPLVEVLGAATERIELLALPPAAILRSGRRRAAQRRGCECDRRWR